MMRIKDILGFEGLYAVSDEGHIIRLYRSFRDARNRLNMRETRVLVVPSDKRGYRTVRLFSHDGRYRRAKVHRLVAEAFCPPFKGEVVNHIDGNPSNNAAGNLEWCTTETNVLHALMRKQHVRLTATQITEVRALSGTVPIKTICDRYNVDRATVQRLVWGSKRRPRVTA